MKKTPNRTTSPATPSKQESPRTEVVNVRDSGFNVYIGRAVPWAVDPRCHKTSIWRNPYYVDARRTPEQAVAKYRQLLIGRLTGSDSGLWLFQLRRLRGKRLGCWDAPEICHGDPIVEAVIADQEGRLDEWIKGPAGEE